MSSLTPKIVKAYPPNYNELVKHFPIKGVPGIIYAYGDRIYNPSGVNILPWIREHEYVHCRRQLETHGVDEWWWRYIHEPMQRLDEEVLAHRREWELAQDLLSPRDRMHYLDQMVARLSGPIYNHLVSPDEALRLITEKK